VKVDRMVATDPSLTAASARVAEDEGYDGIWTAETAHDPFLALTLAAEHTTRPEIGTSIAVAFARTPMSTAQLAHQLHTFSGGRMILGLGSQVKAHITRRFSMPWSRPAARMREYVLAMHAIWETWNDGKPLDFHGDFYSFSLMTPYFVPGPTGHGRPKVFLAGVNERMTDVAGEVADGFLCHGFTTARYVRERSMPALGRGLATSGRSFDDFEVAGQLFITTGVDDAAIERGMAGARSSIAFYASTPAYKPVLDLHGWGELGPELTALSKQGRWDEMSRLIDDEMVDAFSIVGHPDDLPDKIAERFGGMLTRVGLGLPADLDLDAKRSIFDRVRAI
jgi:probable F420-dependent oxidoreductase